MCGICGLAFRDPARKLEAGTLKRMTDVVRHRGPDSEGFHSEPGVALGVRRLRIVDLVTGDQPLCSEDGTLVLVCNGEVYNAPELRAELEARGHRFRTRSDAEVVVHLYEDAGPESVRRLRGMFAFALWDGRRRTLMLARDRFGIKPLSYSLAPEGLCFGSEIKSILAARWFDPALDPLAVRDMFRFGYIVGPRTLFTGARRLPPAHYLLYRDGRASLHSYWRLSFPSRGAPDLGRSAEDWADALLHKIEESVRLHLRSDVPVAAWLSGGVDSSSVVALAGRLSGRPIDTFSATFEEPEYDEVARHKTLADFDGYVRSNRRAPCRAADFELLPKATWHCENMSASGLEIVHMRLAAAASPDFKVALSGEGSDEVFGGYLWYAMERALRPLLGLPHALRRLLLLGSLLPRLRPGAARILSVPRGMMSLDRFRALTVFDRPNGPPPPFSVDLRASLERALPGDEEPAMPESFARWHPFCQLQAYEFAVRLPDFVVRMADHAAMAHSVEARVPFLDHELVEFCAAIPPRLKLKGRREKHILREAVRGLLPAEIVRRRKVGLRAPYQEWLRGDLPEFAAEMLSPGSVRRKGYFDPEAVSELRRRHRAGGRGCGRMLMACLVVQLMDEVFLRGY
jgi:asparagine synthase (glutamine-hydrolysing)